MNDLNKKAFGGLFFLLVVMGALLFVPAWTLDFWQAWAFLGVFGASALAITVYLMKKDPQLLKRRIHAGPIAEKEQSQKIIQTITSLGFTAMIVLPALDHRFAWSAVPSYLAVVGDLLVALGFLVIFFVYKENSFASATIQVYSEQKVISTGPYALVRHPMYVGGLIMFVGVSMALGSWWGLLALVLMMPALLWRILEEEKLLAKDLPGYAAYRNEVQYRLIPHIW